MNNLKKQKQATIYHFMNNVKKKKKKKKQNKEEIPVPNNRWASSFVKRRLQSLD